MKDQILAIINETFEIDNASENISRQNCPQWDSLNHLNLILALEEEFNVSIEPEEINQMIDYEQIVTILSAKNR